MSTSLATVQQPALSMTETRMSVGQLIEQRTAIVQVMQSAMRKEIDFGVIPGTPKPTLYKPGSEKILALFHLAAFPEVEDLSTPDTIRYRVKVTISHAPTGNVLGAGIGEASSAESKYQWRRVVCDEEWAATPEDRRRVKWAKGRDGAYATKQVRAEMDDVANTVLKMAKKRAQIDAVLTVTAASDIFAQDLEDLKSAGLDPGVGETEPQSQALPQNLQRKDAAPVNQPAPHPHPQPAAHQEPTPAQQSGGGAVISESEAKQFWKVAINRVVDYKIIMDYLRGVHGVAKKDEILKVRFAEAMKWAETGAVD